MLESSNVLRLEVLKFHACCQGVTAAHAAAQFGHAPMLHLLAAEGAEKEVEMETAGNKKQKSLEKGPGTRHARSRGEMYNLVLKPQRRDDRSDTR